MARGECCLAGAARVFERRGINSSAEFTARVRETQEQMRDDFCALMVLGGIFWRAEVRGAYLTFHVIKGISCCVYLNNIFGRLMMVVRRSWKLVGPVNFRFGNSFVSLCIKGMAYTDKVFCRTGHNVFN